MVLSTRAAAGTVSRLDRTPGKSSKLSSWLLLLAIFAGVAGTHLTLLRLPYFWDEGGYYIPAALDFFSTGTLVPQSTLTNAHPPLPAVLLAAWWKVFGFHVLATRLFVCLVSATALLGVFRLARTQVSLAGATATTALTAIYPIWFAQSTLAHADTFAAAFTLWGLAFYFNASGAEDQGLRPLKVGILFSLAALAKETAIVTPLVLAGLELFPMVRAGRSATQSRWRQKMAAALIVPVFPLAAWYAYHRYKTGFIFGNPEFLRYNATANLDAHRVLICLYHRVVHLTLHMNMFVAVLCAGAALLMPAVAGRGRLSRPVLLAFGLVLAANTVAFSVLGGALLTRYLLPMYPLVILICVAAWQSHVRRWEWLAGFTGVAFLLAIWINPPYAFAPEDNLTYRDMIVVHQQAIAFLQEHYPEATVLTAWPATAEISRPELGYSNRRFRFAALDNFSLVQIERAAADPGAYDTALLFSTKWAPAPDAFSLSRRNERTDARFFDFHLDLRPPEAAAVLHGEVVWQASRGGEWAAILRFPRIVDASVEEQVRRSEQF